jgi:hypothetical protein
MIDLIATGQRASQALAPDGALSPPLAALCCAWCLVEQGRPLGTGSHGICLAHADQVRQQRKARRGQP